MTTLKNILLVNALSSGLTGLLLSVMPGTIAGIFEVSTSWPFLLTGLFLVLFAILAYYTSTKKEVNRPLVKLIIYLDSVWVAASFIVVAAQLFTLSLWGYVLMTGVAVWVGCMALLQHLALRRIVTDA